MRQVLLISSILKPVSDVRSYLRLAMSFRDESNYEVHLSGVEPTTLPTDEHFEFHVTGKFSRGLFSRIKSHAKTLKLFRKIKPDIIVITSVELIPIAIFYKLLNTTKLVYDIQENYALNIRHQGLYPLFVKKIMIKMIDLIQRFSNRYIDLYILAELCYKNELNFLKKNSFVLENKVPAHYSELPKKKDRQEQVITFIFTGTLAKATGIETAIDWYLQLKSYLPHSKLIIAGFAAQSNYRKYLNNLVQEHATIELFTDSQPLPHEQIMTLISQADIGIVSYPITPANKDKVPTKVFEYSFMGLPILMKSDSSWYRSASTYGSAIPVDHLETNALMTIELIQNTLAKPKESIAEAALWLQEKQLLVDSINALNLQP